MWQLINVELIFANDTPKILSFAEFIFANWPIILSFFLGIAELDFAKKGKIRNN